MYRLQTTEQSRNAISVSLPRIDEILDKLGKAKFFSILDLSQGFHQVLIDEPDREKTAFSNSIKNITWIFPITTK